MHDVDKITDKKRILIFINILISCIASSMLATALTTALPPIIEDLHISVTTGQWLTSAYSLAMGIMMPLTAFLITRFPTRKLYLTAILLFIIGLFVCGIAPNFSIMMLGRIFQASGNGIMTAMAQVILLTIYPPEMRGAI
ncbi:MAG: MFS transporter, partial [Anaerotignum sp.]